MEVLILMIFAVPLVVFFDEIYEWITKWNKRRKK